MSWDEFKKLVDEKLAQAGRDGSIEVWYIDVVFPDECIKPVISNEFEKPVLIVSS